MVEKNRLISWARSCHFDGCIAVKEVKGKRWMAILSKLEIIGNFDIDDQHLVGDLNKSWKEILKTINSLDCQKIDKLNSERRE